MTNCATCLFQKKTLVNFRIFACEYCCSLHKHKQKQNSLEKGILSDHFHLCPIPQGNSKRLNTWIQQTVNWKESWSLNCTSIVNNNIHSRSLCIESCKGGDNRHFRREVTDSGMKDAYKIYVCVIIQFTFFRHTRHKNSTLNKADHYTTFMSVFFTSCCTQTATQLSAVDSAWLSATGH